MHGIATDSIIIEKTHIQTRPFTPFFKKLEKLEKIKDVSPFPGPDEGWELEAEDYPLFYGVDYMAAENPHQEIVSDLHGIWKGLLRKQGVELRMDVFLYYRDSEGKLKPTAPGLWAIPLGRTKTSSYNVEKEPPPLFAVEVTSEGSRALTMLASVIETCRIHGVLPCLYLAQVVAACRKGEHTPPLAC